MAERYAYDAAGNILEKEIAGKMTTYRYDEANQLVSSTDPDDKTTKYAYDAAGRMTREGAKTYRYGYLDKVLAVTEGMERRAFTYHADGQLATATRTGGPRSVAAGTGRAASPLAAETETFLWDGLALIRRGSTSYVNEPHANGGSPILSSKDGVMFNDVLGTTVGTDGKGGYAAASLTAFGDPVPGGPRSVAADALFTGKPRVDGLGYAFLFRNYRPTLGKWQTADPLGYPDGWNQMAYCGNEVMRSYDLFGAFVCHFLDANAGGLPVYSAAELDIGVGGGDDYGGVFFVGVWNVDISLSGIVSIDFLMYIDIFDCKYDYQFESGEETRYCPHYYEHDNSMGKNNVHEAIEAHERAHASYFFNFILSDIYEILTGFGMFLRAEWRKKNIV